VLTQIREKNSHGYLAGKTRPQVGFGGKSGGGRVRSVGLRDGRYIEKRRSEKRAKWLTTQGRKGKGSFGGVGGRRDGGNGNKKKKHRPAGQEEKKEMM